MYSAYRDLQLGNEERGKGGGQGRWKGEEGQQKVIEPLPEGRCGRRIGWEGQTVTTHVRYCTHWSAC